MAKRHRGSVSALGKSAEARIEGFAEDLGNLLGTARAKAENWMGQRQTIVKNLTELLSMILLSWFNDGIVTRGILRFTSTSIDMS